MSPAKCLCVMYHYVRDRRDGCEAGVRGLDVAAFENQLDMLCELLTPIDWPTFAAWRAGDGHMPADAFLLTFDDALSDHAEVVLPILESRGLQGVFFVQTGALVDAEMDTAHQIHLLMCRMDPAALSLAVHQWLERHPAGHGVETSVRRDDAERVYPYETPERADLKYLLLALLPLALRKQLVSALFAEHVGDARDHAARWYLTWNQIEQMQRLGHTIGGHGHRHLPFGRLSPTEQKHDFRRCAAVLREKLGADRRPFSYPYGSCDNAIARRCASAGFVNGFTTRENWIHATDDDHRLGRVDTIHIVSVLEKEFQCNPA